MRSRWPRQVLLAIFLVPWLILLALGGYWLFEKGLLFAWTWMVLAISALSWIGLRRIKKPQIGSASSLPVFEPDQALSPAAEAAWAKVEKMAEELDSARVSLSEPDKLLPLAYAVLIEVAKRFHPDKGHAELDVSLPDVLLIVERVSHDMRILVTDQVPASHLITIKEGVMLWEWKENLKKLGIIASLGQLLASPVGGVLYELRMVFFKRVTRYPLEELERWLLQNLIRKIGYYAILLFGGELRTDNATVERLSMSSTLDMEFAQRQDGSVNEPLRILVAGQSKSGKSSLINALFGELRATTDVLPHTHALTPYRWEREGEFLGLVFDSPGYGDEFTWVEAQTGELQKVDLILLACAATHAGRAADAQFLKTLRGIYAKTPERIPPPIIVAVTHIDLLRPAREWHPPYDLGKPTSQKETHILACMEEIAQALPVPMEHIHAVCLKAGEGWNIEAIWAAIAGQLPQARRVRYLRCLKETRSRERWELIFRQFSLAGKYIVGGIRKAWAGK